MPPLLYDVQVLWISGKEEYHTSMDAEAVERLWHSIKDNPDFDFIVVEAEHKKVSL